MKNESQGLTRNRRRGNADGTISKVLTKTGSVKWRWRLTVGWNEQGQQKRLTGTVASRGDAERALAEMRVARDQGRLMVPQEVTLGPFSTKWLEGKYELAASTRYQYELYLRVYLPQELKDMRLQAIKLSHLRALDESMSKRKLGVALRRKVFSLLRAVLQEAILHEIISIDPGQSMRLRATTEEEQRREKKKILQGSEFRSFFEQARSHHFYPLIYTMFSLGLRRGEALGLRWSDIDLERRVVNIRQQVRLVGNTPEIGSLKTTSSKRTVALSEDLLAVLLEQKKEQESWHDFCEETWTDTGLAFTTQIGTMIHPRNVNTFIARICRQLGIPTFSSHTGRHTHVSARLSRNEKLESVAAVVGHKNGQITFDTYRHLLDEEKLAVPLDLSEFMR